MKHVKLFEELINEAKYNAWTMPDRKMLAQEYRVEHEKKGRRDFATEEEFVHAVTNAEIVEVDMRMDRKIGYRSGTKDFDSLHNLISTYASYPKYRNEDTLKDLYKRFGNGKPIDYPIVFKDRNGRMTIFSGNTRMDIAFQMGFNPKVLMVNI
tara:strand:+ start:643 stop:1101 length:459 start_codon:yes stop_codon:yes gene_type:complete